MADSETLHTNIVILIIFLSFFLEVQTRGKAIIGMSLWAIKTLLVFSVIIHVSLCSLKIVLNVIKMPLETLNTAYSFYQLMLVYSPPGSGSILR